MRGSPERLTAPAPAPGMRPDTTAAEALPAAYVPVTVGPWAVLGIAAYLGLRARISHASGRRVAAILLAAALVLTIAAPALFQPRAAAAGLKVVLIVGPVESLTSTYRSWMDNVATAAAANGAAVTKVYSPNATWAKVLNAIQGANIVVYMGHGNGFPNPYSSILSPTKVDGFGLNDPLNLSDNAHIYYGESYIRNYVKLAPNAVVFLSHACYAAGSSESWDKDPTVSVAEQRVDNFAAGFIGAGARAVFALAHDDPSPYVTKILTGSTITMKTIFETGAGWTGTWVKRLASVRSPGFDEELDPSLDNRLSPPQPTYYLRSLVTYPGLTASQVRGLSGSTPTPSPSPSPGSPTAYDHWAKVTTGPVNVRAGPSTSYAILGQYAAGADFYAAQLQTAGGSYTAPDGTTRTDWLSTTYSGQTGWVGKGFTTDDSNVRIASSGTNIRTGPATTYAIYAYTTSTNIVRKSDGLVLGPLSMSLPLSGYVAGGSYTIGSVTSSSWAKVYLDGGWRYVAKLLVTAAP
jgi:uncharacterized protein YraI